MGRINEHRVRIQSQVQIAKTSLEKGMIVKARYSPIIDNKRGSAKEYMLLILNPRYMNKVHALTLDAFGYIRINELASKVGLVYIPSFQKKRKLDIPKLEMKESSQRFYHSKLKGSMSQKWGDSYRTFDIAHFGGMFLVEYKFNKQVEEEFLITEEQREKVQKQLKNQKLT
jgi:hypothetical protein